MKIVLFGGHVGPDDAGQRVTVGYRQSGVAQRGSLRNEFLRV
jgi:hypothetical protein